MVPMNEIDRAQALADELIGLCRAMGKPLAGDFITIAMEHLTGAEAPSAGFADSGSEQPGFFEAEIIPFRNNDVIK